MRSTARCRRLVDRGPDDPERQEPGRVSHISFYNSAAPVPLPAAGWLLIAGLGELGALARRRKAAAA